MKSLLASCAHRSHPYPASLSWVMTQCWDDLLFAHWSFDPAAIRHLIPEQLALDTFDGRAYIGIVPFKMRKVRMRLMPSFCGVSNFLELNVRTYVTVNNIPGVYFFSLDASSLLAVEGARTWFRLPYYYAEMRSAERDGKYFYESRRIDRRGAAAGLKVSWRPKEVMPATPDSIEHFLTARYCLYTISGDNSVLRAHVHHLPWPLQTAYADITVNTMLDPLGLTCEGDPIVHFSRTLLTVEWAPELVP
ncbi:MAG: DUF2071 domain-containing protein [Candidatus Obscuribacterales bacterium]|nr:DUF2071 domain-containing protein [Candidatus Obscuribacterales bacterium]